MYYLKKECADEIKKKTKEIGSDKEILYGLLGIEEEADVFISKLYFLTLKKTYTSPDLIEGGLQRYSDFFGGDHANLKIIGSLHTHPGFRLCSMPEFCGPSCICFSKEDFSVYYNISTFLKEVTKVGIIPKNNFLDIDKWIDAVYCEDGNSFIAFQINPISFMNLEIY